MVAATFTMKFRSAFAVIAAAFTAFAIIITLEGTDAMEVFNENEDDYAVDLFGSSTPKPEVSDTTTLVFLVVIYIPWFLVSVVWTWIIFLLCVFEF